MPLFCKWMIAQLLWSHSQQGIEGICGAGHLGFIVFNDHVHVRVELASAHTNSRHFCPSFYPREFLAEMLHLSISRILNWYTTRLFPT